MNFFNLLRNTLTKKLKIKFLILIFFFVVLSLLETLSVSLIFPFVNLLLDINQFVKILDDYNLTYVKYFIQDKNINYLILTFLFLLLLTFLFKHIFSLFSYHFAYNFCKLAHQFLSAFFLQNYISKKFQDYATSNLSSKLNNMLLGVEMITTAFIYNLITIFGEFLIIVFFFSILVFLQPKATLICLVVFIPLIIIFFKLSGAYLSNITEKYLFYGKKKIQSFNNIAFLFKEIKILNKFDYFTNKFLYNVKSYTDSQKKLLFFKTIPRHFYEFFGLVFVVAFFAISYEEDRNLNKSFAELGLLVAMSYRLLPSINRISVGYIDLKASIPFLKDLQNDKLFNKTKTKKLITEKKFNFENINFKNISFKYRGSRNAILNKINFIISKNDKIGIYGSSGIGKTTILEILTNLYTPTSGTIVVDNKKCQFSFLKKIKFAYVPQNIALLEGGFFENIALESDFSKVNLKKLKLAIKISCLTKLVNSLPNKIKSNISEFGSNISGGQRQRIAIARAIYHDPQILIFDEATNALDKKTENTIFINLEKYFNNKIIIIVSHNKKNLSICNKIYSLKDKKIKLIRGHN
jgi:ABC-type bacteriocin/lantibiotic exporter with double-glycine peptidase domain